MAADIALATKRTKRTAPEPIMLEAAARLQQLAAENPTLTIKRVASKVLPNIYYFDGRVHAADRSKPKCKGRGIQWCGHCDAKYYKPDHIARHQKQKHSANPVPNWNVAYDRTCDRCGLQQQWRKSQWASHEQACAKNHGVTPVAIVIGDHDHGVVTNARIRVRANRDIDDRQGSGLAIDNDAASIDTIIAAATSHVVGMGVVEGDSKRTMPLPMQQVDADTTDIHALPEIDLNNIDHEDINYLLPQFPDNHDIAAVDTTDDEIVLLDDDERQRHLNQLKRTIHNIANHQFEPTLNQPQSNIESLLNQPLVESASDSDGEKSDSSDEDELAANGFPALPPVDSQVPALASADSGVGHQQRINLAHIIRGWRGSRARVRHEHRERSAPCRRQRARVPAKPRPEPGLYIAAPITPEECLLQPKPLYRWIDMCMGKQEEGTGKYYVVPPQMCPLGMRAHMSLPHTYG